MGGGESCGGVWQVCWGVGRGNERSVRGVRKSVLEVKGDVGEMRGEL